MITPLSTGCSGRLRRFVSPEGKEKQIDYILTRRRYLRNVKDAEANDMIHIGSDHRCVMSTFLINMLGKDTHAKKKKEKHETIGYNEHKQTEKHQYLNVRARRRIPRNR